LDTPGFMTIARPCSISSSVGIFGGDVVVPAIVKFDGEGSVGGEYGGNKSSSSYVYSGLSSMSCIDKLVSC